MIRGLLIKPDHQPEVVEFDNNYKEFQRLVEGNFEMPYLFDDVDIVLNEKGKLNGSLPNKFLYYQNKLIDILYGNILIVNSNLEGETISLTDDLIKKYTKIFNNDAIIL